MMSEDLIKRSDAIKALCDAVDNKGSYEGEWLYTDEFCKAIDSVPPADNEVVGKLKTAIKNEEICKNCPTAERISGENLLGAMALGFSYGMEADRPQGEWIPCSERLPSDDNNYLIVDGDGEMAVGYYRDDADAWDNCCFGWLEREDEDEQPIRLGKVVAWMPLPEPWEGADDE